MIRALRGVAASIVAAAAMTGLAGIFAGHAPFALVGSVAILLVVAIVRPGDALVLLAAFGPLGGALGALVPYRDGWTLPLLLAFTAGFALQAIWRRRGDEDGWLHATALAWMIVVGASLVMVLAPLRASLTDWAADGFPLTGQFPVASIGTAALAICGVTIFVATSEECTDRRELADRVTRMLLISIAAVGTVNVYRFFEIALRRPPFPASVVDVHRWVRISATFPDVNAAGAFFLLAAPVALSALTDRRYRGVGAVAILPVLAGLWLSGSRTALIAFALTLTLMAGLAPDRTRRWRLGFIGAILILCLLITVFNPRAKTAGDSVIAFGVRREMAAATLRVLQEHPLTGVGIGQFQPRSPQYMSPLMKSWYPSENAHNQFLQAAAETGLPGFAAFAVLVALGAMPAALVVARSRDPLERGTAFGVLAFLATFLTNHPLLMPEVAVAFWIVLGTCRARRLRGAMA